MKDEAKIKRKALRSKGGLKNRREEGRNDLPAPSEHAEWPKHRVRTVFHTTIVIAAATACDRPRRSLSSIAANPRSAPRWRAIDNYAHRLPSCSTNIVYTQPFKLIFSDLWRPAPFLSSCGYNYYTNYVNASTKHTSVYPPPQHKQKNQKKNSIIIGVFKHLKSMVAL